MKIVKYIAIIILSIGLYFTWLQKDKFENKSLELKEKTQELKQKIQTLKKDLEKQYSKKIEKTIPQNQPIKTIKIILPKEQIDYLDIIPDVNYSDFNLKKVEKIDDEDIKITPNIRFDDNKDIDKIELKIQTKF